MPQESQAGKILCPGQSGRDHYARSSINIRLSSLASSRTHEKRFAGEPWP